MSLKSSTKTLLIFISIFFFASLCPAQITAINPEYLGIINQQVQSSISYPPEALEQGWEGIVQVKFVINQDGQITDIYIAESSGYPLLDAAAMFAIQDASPYPFPNEYKDETEIEILLPINYSNPGFETPQPAYPAPEYTRTDYSTERFQTINPSEPYYRPTDQFIETYPQLPGESTIQLTGQQERVSMPAEQEYSLPQLPSAPSLPANTIERLPKELGYFVDLALKNNKPTKVAQEEIKLAQIKVTEAQRNFLPNLKVGGYNTQGKTYGLEYEERELKLQVDQPLYYGGRLADSLNQAIVNLEITRRNYDRLKIDVMHKTETAYHNLVAAKMHLDQKYEIRQEAEEMLQKVEKLEAAGMVIPLEANSARSWLEQIKLQIESIRQDQFMAEVTFKQVLNIDKVPDLKEQFSTATKLDIDLDKLQETALQYRPEVYLSNLLVKFNEYGQKVENDKNKPTLDFVTSYGYYQGHYITEPWKASNNWYMGLKAGIPWETNTLNTALTTEHSQPKFGQTSPTSSSTLSSELTFLDNFKRVSDKKKSDVDLQRAISDYNETTKTISFEVQDAFLSYKKTIIQLATAEADMKYRRNQADVIKIRSMVGDASLSDAIESLYSFSDAQTKYFQALATAQISLTNLKKACGYGFQI